MAETIEISVGDLYADLHANYAEMLGEQYAERMRQVVEDQLHQLNQQVDRAREQQIDAGKEMERAGDADEMEIDPADVSE